MAFPFTTWQTKEETIVSAHRSHGATPENPLQVLALCPSLKHWLHSLANSLKTGLEPYTNSLTDYTMNGYTSPAVTQNGKPAWKAPQDADWDARAPGGKVPALHEVCMPASQSHWMGEDHESWSARWQGTRDEHRYDAVCSGPLRVCFSLTYASWHVKWSSFGLILEKLICFLASVVMGTGVEPWKRFCSNCDYWNEKSCLWLQITWMTHMKKQQNMGWGYLNCTAQFIKMELLGSTVHTFPSSLSNELPLFLVPTLT